MGEVREWLILDPVPPKRRIPPMEWKKGRPTQAGYYLGAWDNGNNRLMTSELWFNPDSGWWSSRGYMSGPMNIGEEIKVVAWMPMPVCEQCPTCGK